MCVEIKQENDEDEEEDPEGGITSVQLALHNKNVSLYYFLLI